MTIDRSRQLTVRACVAGMLLGGLMSLSNLYVALKTGMSMGVSITAGILAFAIFSFLARARLIKEEFGMLENNAMQSVASAAGYMTGGGTVAAIGALMMITGEPMKGWTMFFWISSIAMLGAVMAIPMKQQMINVEKLPFPTGLAAAETLKALHGGADSVGGKEKARSVGWGGAAGALVAFARDAHASWIPWNLPEKFKIPGLIYGRPLTDYTISVEASLIMIGAGAIMGFRAAWSMLLGAAVNYLLLAPWLIDKGVIPGPGYRNIVAWSVWFGASVILSSGLLAFAFEWRTVVRAVKSVTGAFRGTASDDGEVPMHWFVIGLAILSPIVVYLQWLLFGIKPWMGALAVALSFFVAIVASRATGETDTTPTGALGKITQITYGVLDPGNVTTNAMTSNVTAGSALHAADLLTDLKSGYVLGADPKQQFWAQFFGVCAGAVFVVPAFRLLVPTAADLGSGKWPAPGAQQWKSVALMLSKGIESLHPSARWAIVIGLAMGVALVLIERWKPAWKRWIPLASGLGLGFSMPGNYAITQFFGALLALWLERRRPRDAERLVLPVSSGFIAGESLTGVLIAVLVVLGILLP